MKLNTPTGNNKVLCFICSLFFIVIILNSCSTEKNAFANKAFHYTTTRFNGFFHGKEALKLAKKNLEKNHIDNYEEILNIYREGDKSQSEAEFTNLNRAISKASKMIENHSMKFKVKGVPQEANAMIDDCYFLLAQAKYYKMQYDSSIQTYKFILNHFKKGKLYYPVHFELIKSYIKKGKVVDAETKIKFLQEDKEFPKKYKGQFEVVKSHYYLKTKNYKEAIKSLETALSLVKKAKLKTRLSFILAQLYEKEKNTQKAAELYQYVVKKSLSYELAFQAKMNLALNQNGKNQASMISDLNRMLKDKKNQEYQDQIYFVLAKVYQKNGEMEKAIEMYKKSAATSTNNPKQKAYSHLAIADYYFSIPKYIPAQAYYDSCLSGLPKTHEGYEKIAAKAENLNDLVERINIIQKEDSLQKVAALSEGERQKLIENIIKTLEEKEEMDALAEKAKLEEIKAKSATQANVGGWIFDNPSLLASANAEFIGIWGNRKLEDNWRRSNKNSIVPMDNSDNSVKQLDENGNPKLAENKNPEYYLKNLPFTPEAIELSNQKIKKALYETAVIFKDKLNDKVKSNEYFEELNRRFPENDNKVVSLYQLYRNYETAGETAKADVKKQQILNEFPNSEYAQLIKNPNKGAEDEELRKQFNEYYQKSLADYQSGNYQKVIQDVEQLYAQEKDNPLKANFELLKAFSIGKLKGKAEFELALKLVSDTYQGTTVGDDAKVILDELLAEKMKNSGLEKMQIEKQKTFVTAPDETHFLVVIYNSELINPDEFQKQISSFTESEGLKVYTESWAVKENILIIESFSSALNAKNYHQKLKDNVLEMLKQIGELHFEVSSANFQKLRTFKELEKYLQFYKENY